MGRKHKGKKAADLISIYTIGTTVSISGYGCAIKTISCKGAGRVIQEKYQKVLPKHVWNNLVEKSKRWVI